MAEEKKIIKEVSESDLDTIIGAMGNELLEISDNQDSNIFSKNNIDNTDNIEITKVKPVLTEEEIEAAKVLAEKNKTIITDSELIVSLGEEDDDIKDETKKTINKDSELETLRELVKSGDLLLFEAEDGQAEKPLEEYTKKERTEVIKANLLRVRDEERANAIDELFEALPPKAQHVLKYALDNGDKLENLFSSLAQSIQIENLDITTEVGQEKIIRMWGAHTELTAEEIDEEVNSLKDMPGALEKKAKLYKPKLDVKQKQIVEQDLKNAETRKKQGEANAAKYRETIIKTLAVGDLDGLKLNNSLQGRLYNGLVNFDKKASNGRMTNALGMLLEKYNSLEPNPALVAKVFWLLDDSKGFEEAILARGKNEINIEVAKKLKTAESQKSTATLLDSTQNNNGTKRTIKKPAVNVFSRT